MSRTQLRVVKVGGSLLDDPQLPEKLKQWLARDVGGRQLLLAGGGATVDAIRALDRVHQLGDAVSHRLAIHALSLTAAFLHELLGRALLAEVPLLTRWESVRQCQSQCEAACAILDAGQLYAEELETGLSIQHGLTSLPESWEVTSDSIAAQFALALDAAEVVLVKSADPPQPVTLQNLAEHGFVDAYFSQLAQRVPVRCVNLRADQMPEFEIQRA